MKWDTILHYKVIDECYFISLDASSTQTINIELVLRKGVYTYGHTNALRKLHDLLSRKNFNITLGNEVVSNATYKH